MKSALFFLLIACAPLGAAPPDTAPPRDVRLVEKKWEALSSREVDDLGAQALALSPQKWRHAETENFIVHYRRVTEAQRAVREIEYDLWFVARTLGAGKERYAKKSHVYIFQDDAEWSRFLDKTGQPEWFGSFAHGDDLFLHIGGPGEGFDSHGLAHEAAHAAVARLYPGRRWPLWLNEGFAETMGGASVAARKQQYLKGLQRTLREADLPLEELTAMEVYPQDHEAVSRLYQTSERLVRFLLTDYPRERIAAFVEAVLGGATLEAAVAQVYGDRVKDYAAFQKAYERFGK